MQKLISTGFLLITMFFPIIPLHALPIESELPSILSTIGYGDTSKEEDKEDKEDQGSEYSLNDYPSNGEDDDVRSPWNNYADDCFSEYDSEDNQRLEDEEYREYYATIDEIEKLHRTEEEENNRYLTEYQAERDKERRWWDYLSDTEREHWYAILFPHAAAPPKKVIQSDNGDDEGEEFLPYRDLRRPATAHLQK